MFQSLQATFVIITDLSQKVNGFLAFCSTFFSNLFSFPISNSRAFPVTFFPLVLSPGPRSGLNDDEEMAAAVKAAETDLIYKVIIKTWFKDMSRADAVAICNKLFGSRDSIQIFSATLTANDVARNWNAEHSNEKPIYMTTRAIEETFGSI